MNLNKKAYITIGFCVLLVLIYLLNKKESIKPLNNSDFIVQISSAVGKISYKQSQDSKGATSPKFPESLYSNSELKTFEGSKAQLSFENGWVIDLVENSHAKFQVWEVDDQSKYLLHILSGSYDLISKGTENGLLVLYKNNFYSPGAKLVDKKSIAMSIIANNISKQTNLDKSDDLNNKLPDETTKKNLTKNEVSTLYIETSILKNKHLFEKCLANRIRENNIVSGRLLVGFNVTELGTLKDINIIENKTQDKKIESCVMDVFARIKIRNYNGPKTFFAFPVDFK